MNDAQPSERTEAHYRMSNAELAQAIKDINNQRANAWASTAAIFQKHLQDLLDEQGRRAMERKAQ